MIDRILAADRRHVWHPYSPLDAPTPLVVERAEGARLFLADGRVLFDANASWWVSALGHGHPKLKEALVRQVERLDHCALAGITHEPAALLAEELVARTPGASRVFYTDDGSTAVECAAKLALQHHVQSGRPRRRRFLALEGAFHGDTIGASSLGDVELFKRAFGSVLFECVRARPGDHPEAFAAMERALDQAGDELAAVFVEPRVQGANGMAMYGAELLQRLAARAKERGVLFVADEVFTGYGRTGPFWASHGAGVVPDMICTAKGFSGGMLPMGAVLIAEHLTEGFDGGRERAFLYGHSFCGNPLGAAVARAVLRVYDEERILDGIPARSALLRETFDRLGGLPGASGARVLGMIAAVDLGGPGYLGDLGWRVYDEALRRGAYLRPLGNTVYVTPPLNIPEAELRALLAIVEASVRAVLVA